MNPFLPSLAIGGDVIRNITSYLSPQGSVLLEKLIIHLQRNCHILWKLEDHYCVHIKPTFVPIMKQHPIHPFPAYVLKVSFNIVPYFFLGLPVMQLQGTSNMEHLNLFYDVMRSNGSE